MTADRTAALEAAQRIIERNKVRKSRPSLAELEAILQTPEAGSVTINPDGSIGTGESDALTIARALLSTAKEADEMRHDLERYIKIASDEATEADRLREALAIADELIALLPRQGDHWNKVMRYEAARSAALLPSEGKPQS